MTLILASGSPRRKHLLGQLGIPFQVMPSRVEEREPQLGERPASYARALALQKATDTRSRHPSDVILAADTVVVIDGAVLGKPRDEHDALRMLRMLRGRRHSVTTAVIVLCGETVTGGELTTLVTMSDFSEDDAIRYIASGEPMDKAGAYALQERGGAFVRSFVGCYNAVVGLPLCLTSRLFCQCGMQAASLSNTACARCPVSSPR